MEMNLIMKAALRMRMAAKKTNPKLCSVEIISLGSYESPFFRIKEELNIKQGTADLEFIADKRMVIVPLMQDNKLVAYRILE